MATGAAIAGAAIAGGGQLFKGIEQQKAAKEQARILGEEAALVREKGEFDIRRSKREFNQLLGQQRLRLAASGNLLEGSPLLILDQTIRDREEEIANIRGGVRARVSRLGAEARAARRAGRRALIGGILGAAGQGLSAGSKLKG
jgi:hypothetical protein